MLEIENIFKKASLGDGMKVADLGCGMSGTFIYGSAKKIGKNGLVYAVDVVKNVLESIDQEIKNESHPNIKTVWSDLEKYKATKINSGSLDFVFMSNVLHQNEDRLSILRESIRLLKKEGRIMIIDWNDNHAPVGPQKDKKIDKNNLIIAMKKLGCQEEEEFVAGPYHFALIFIKK